ncbi:MAG: esterase family protein [Thermotogae bacterium]|nr:esterase family protein [Thermotogota bacterium]MCP5465234.1 esterase family protein [Thermotogota bacterium]HOO75008.1 alpha/beta hydrolase family protein [Tepiditoga sp.]
MAFLEMKFFSEVLGVGSSINVILPDISRELMDKKVKFQTVYLLHGLSDDHTAWVRRTSVERYAQDNLTAVVMPAADHSYYCNMVYGKDYWTYISEEVINVSRYYFPLSEKREDTFAAGLSMGGYGSFKLGLLMTDTFCEAASFSGALVMEDLFQKFKGDTKRDKMYFNIFGGKSGKNTKDDLIYNIKNFSAENKKNTRFYQCCGTEDFLYDINAEFKKTANEYGLNLTYEESSGTHEWGYWDKSIKRAFEWFSLKRNVVK